MFLTTAKLEEQVKQCAKHFGNLEDTILNKGEATLSIGGRPFKIKKQFLDDLEKYTLEEEVKKLRKPILIMHSPHDLIVGIENAASLYHKAIHPKSLYWWNYATHRRSWCSLRRFCLFFTSSFNF